MENYDWLAFKNNKVLMKNIEIYRHESTTKIAILVNDCMILQKNNLVKTKYPSISLNRP